MNIFQRQIDFINNLEAQLFESLRDTFNQFGFVVVDIITEKQLFDRGIDGNLDPLPAYSESYKRIKIKLGQPADRTTLRSTGSFYASLEIRAFADRYIVSSDVTHETYLIERYGEDIYRPTNNKITEFLTNFYLPILKQTTDGQFTR